MEKREVNTIEEAEEIINPLMAEQKWAITVAQNPDGKIIIQWAEHKKYIAQDGVEYPDEVWTTKEGDMKFIQDLEHEHAQNIIRMLLRQEREAKAALDVLYQAVTDQLSGKAGELEDEDDQFVIPPNTTLH